MRTTDHFYQHNGVYVPSVTKVLDIVDKGGALIGWVKKLIRVYIQEQVDGGRVIDKKNVLEFIAELMKLNETVLTDAGDFGSVIHNHLEAIGKGIPINLEALKPKEKRCVSAFIAWKDKHVKKFIQTEQEVFGDDYAGTLDAVVELNDGRVAVLDYKTSGAIYDTYGLQVAAYAHALPMHVDTAYILRFEKKEDVKKDMEEKEVENLEGGYEVFRYALGLWLWKFQDKLDKVNNK